MDLAAYDARMFSMADRLFLEFHRLPVGDVLRAIARARMTLRDQGCVLPEPGQVEPLVREQLHGADGIAATLEE